MNLFLADTLISFLQAGRSPFTLLTQVFLPCCPNHRDYEALWKSDIATENGHGKQMAVIHGIMGSFHGIPPARRSLR